MSNVKKVLLKTTVLALLLIVTFANSASAFVGSNWYSSNKRGTSYVSNYNTNETVNNFTGFSTSDFSNIFNSFSNYDLGNFSNLFENVNTNDYMDTSKLDEIMDLFANMEYYDLNELQDDLLSMKMYDTIDKSEIQELINKLPNLSDKNILEYINNYTDSSEVLNKLLEEVENLLGNSDGLGDLGDFGNIGDFGNLGDLGDLGDLGGLGSSTTDSSLPDAQDLYMDARTAVAFAGEDYKANLHASVYFNSESDKWVLLVHPFMLKGSTIANKIGSYYYEKGYNILAPDLRGFGDSEGSVALGFLESLDVYDWINELQAYSPEGIFVHGISLGGATTNFLSGIDGFMNNAPENIKMSAELSSLRELNVVGLIEDCGYTSMTEFSDKSSLIDMGIGLNETNFDYFSDATNSLKYCDLPILIIHGTGDTTVDPSNADTVQNTVNGEVTRWIVEGGSHAFIIMGENADDYKTIVQDFITKYEN